jgi:glyoxalase family protein
MSQRKPILGIHHVTAISSDPQRTLDFYTELLGLRLVKRTVNFDDPGTYHLYFGDETGTPGTILTFFPWPMAQRGSPGVGMVTTTSFGVPGASLGYWEERLLKAGVPVEREGLRFDEEVLTFVDPDGLKLEIVGHANPRAPHPWHNAAVPSEHSIRGFYSVTLSERGYEKTAQLLSVMGFRKIAESGNRFRFDVAQGGASARVDVLCVSEGRHGHMGAGCVHHVAFRVSDDAAQLDWRKLLLEKDLDVTPVRDRQYFQSIYFLEPGGVLFEIATDPPGFAIDEPVESLGELLKLPPWLEPKRSRIEGILPSIQIHNPLEMTSDRRSSS